jgi:hypothetical protein
MTERQLQAFFKKTCEKFNLLFYKTVAVGQQGFPDCTVVNAQGVVAFVELKSPKGTGRLRPNQVRIINELRSYQANVYIISSKEDATAFVERFETRAG